MRTIPFVMSLFMLVSIISGCGSIGTFYTFDGAGILYTHTVQPLTLHRGPIDVIESSNARGEGNQIDTPYASVGWTSNAIGAIAKKAGMKTIHYADMEMWSVLGIWSQRIVHVYGTVEKSQQSSRTPLTSDTAALDIRQRHAFASLKNFQSVSALSVVPLKEYEEITP